MPTFTSSDGLALHYTDEGTGLPLLCLAGLTRDGSDFDYVAPLLEGVRLIRLDYRGRGQSEWGDHTTYTIPVEGRDAVELLDHLGLKQAAVQKLDRVAGRAHRHGDGGDGQGQAAGRCAQ